MIEVVLLVVGLAVCFLGAVGLAMAEVSIVRVRRSQVLVEAKDGSAQAARLLELIDDLPVVLNTVLLVILLLHVTAATIGGVLADRWFGGFGVTMATVVLTIALFLYAEAIPKTKAIQHPHRLALWLTPGLRLLVTVSRPVVSLLAWLVERHTGELPAGSQVITEPELVALAEESAAVGTIDPSDAELVGRSFDFNDRRAREVMVPRDRIVAADAEESVAVALERAMTNGHRRLPVVEGDLDDIVGVVRLRDLVANIQADQRTPVRLLTSTILRCGPDELISQVLDRMQLRGQWLAVVVDQDDRTVGLVTVEDLVAELLGEIEDQRRTARPVRRPRS